MDHIDSISDLLMSRGSGSEKEERCSPDYLPHEQIQFGQRKGMTLTRKKISTKSLRRRTF